MDSRRVEEAWRLGQETHGAHRPWLHTIGCYEAENAPNGWWCNQICYSLRAGLEGEVKPLRYLDSMRKWEDSVTEWPVQLSEMMSQSGPLCWAYVSEQYVCILDRGHNDGAHESG